MKIMKNNRKSRRKVLSIVLSSAMVVTMAAGFGPDTAKAVTTVGTSTPTGTYTINFAAETVAIPESAEYNTTSASESSPWENGDSAATTVTPGTTYYIHADSDTGKTAVETLVAPERPDAPATNVVTIAAGTDSKTTKLTFAAAAAGCQYFVGSAQPTSPKDNKTDVPTVSGEESNIVQAAATTGDHVYMKKKATETAFASAWTDCGVVALGNTQTALANVQLDVANGKLKNTTTDMDYQINLDGWEDCSANETGSLTFANGDVVKVRADGDTEQTHWRTVGTVGKETDPTPEQADAVTFNVAAKTISNLPEGCEYTFESTGAYASVTTNVAFTAGLIKIRKAATATKVASDDVTTGKTVGTETTDANACNATEINIAAGTITGLPDGYEYKMAGDTTYSTAVTGVVFKAGQMKMRKAATTANVAGGDENFKSEIQAAAVAPSYAIDYDKKTTSTAVATADEYQLPDTTTWVKGKAVPEKINLVPGKSYKFRKSATASTLAGAVQTLAVPDIPVTDASTVTIKEGADGTHTVVNAADTFQFAVAASEAGIAGWTDGTNGDQIVEAAAGQHVFVRLKYAAAAFAGTIVDKGEVFIPASDTDKVAAATESAKKALAKFVATNSTTAKNVTDAIDAQIAEDAREGASNPTTAFGSGEGEAFAKVNATKDAEGSIKGVVEITKGEKTENVEVEVAIDKLPKSAADKVAVAKTAADTAVKAIKASNTTTEAVVLAAVKAAVASDIEVSISGYKVTPATTAAAGKVEGTIKLAKGKYAKDELAFNIAIAKLVPAPAPAKPAPKAPAKPVVKKSYTVGGYKYTVTKMGTKTGVVTCKGMTSKKATSVKVPSTIKINTYTMNVESISAKAFYKNTKIKYATIGDKVKTIGDKAFYGCKNLKKVTVGKAVTTVGKSSFGYAKKACVITFNGTKLKTVKSAINYKVSKMVVKAPKSKVKAYKKIMKKAKGLTVKAK